MKSRMHFGILFENEKLIKPSSTTPDHLRIFKLSFFDQLLSPSFGTLFYFYPANGTVDANEISRRIEQLENSLSDVLTRFHPLAGRLAVEGDILLVNCHDQGALYREAILDCQLDEFLERADEDIDLLTPLAPREIFDNLNPVVIAPLLCVQVNKFRCGGLVLAVSIQHTVIDGFINTTFAAEWAKTSRSRMMNEAMFLNFDMDSIFPVIDLSGKMKPFSAPINPDVKLVTKRFLFDGDAISRLKDQVMEGDTARFSQRQPSKVELVTAFIWLNLIRVDQARHGFLRPSITSLSVNLRGKTSLQLPEKCFGNVYIPIPMKFMADDHSKMGLYDFVGLIRDAIWRTLEDLEKASKEDAYSIIIKAHNEIREWSGNAEVCARFGTSLRGFPLYDADFGWGKPSWVATPRLYVPMFMLMDTKTGDGIEAWVNLEENEMLELLRDPYIAALSTPCYNFTSRKQVISDKIFQRQLRSHY